MDSSPRWPLKRPPTPLRLSALEPAPRWRRRRAYRRLSALLGRVPVRYNMRNLQVRWLTTLLTGLAFFASSPC